MSALRLIPPLFVGGTDGWKTPKKETALSNSKMNNAARIESSFGQLFPKSVAMTERRTLGPRILISDSAAGYSLVPATIMWLRRPAAIGSIG